MRRRGSGLAIQHQDLVHGSNANPAARIIVFEGRGTPSIVTAEAGPYTRRAARVRKAVGALPGGSREHEPT